MSSLETSEEADSHGYFVPMIDMLAGVIFILIIMLAAVSLVSRNDFQTAGTMQKEIKQIQTELDQARQQQNTYLEPRRIAQAAMDLLLRRLQNDLASQGVTAQIFPDDGHILVTGPDLFDTNSVSLNSEGQRVARVVAAALYEQVPCLALNAPSNPTCAAYTTAHLDEVTVTATSSRAGGGQNAARALTLLSAIAGNRPALLLLQAVDDRRLFDYGVDSTARAIASQPLPLPAVQVLPLVAPTTDAATMQSSVGTTSAGPMGHEMPSSSPATPSEQQPNAGGVELVFKMNVPSIPAGNK